jgi:spoIIIJ-associated protein
VEWVETTGRSVAEAKDAALDELGVDEADAEFEIIAEAQTGLFGRLRSEARVRARVRPTAPRAKDERRGRDRKRRAAGSSSQGGSPAEGAASAAQDPSPGPAARDSAPAVGRPQPTADSDSSSDSDSDSDFDPDSDPDSGDGDVDLDVTASSSAPPPSEAGDEASRTRRRSRDRRRGGNRPGGTPTEAQRVQAEHLGGDDEDVIPKGAQVEVDLDQQAAVAVDFLTKLTAEFGVHATVNVARPDEDTVEVQLTGPDLGILIGPKGQTLVAVQNLTRTVVFNETGGNNGHINVDISGYRQKRTEALIRFAEQAANHVKTSGQRTALEPMSSIDRKIVHDTIANIDGVSTISEGEEPRRRVVVLPS